MLTYFLKNIVFYFSVFVSAVFILGEIQGGLNMSLLLPLGMFTVMIRILFFMFITTTICDKVIDLIINRK